MSYDTLLIDQSDAVLTITVNRPEVLNAQSRVMREELDAALAAGGGGRVGAHVQYASLPWEIGFREAKEYLFTGDWMTAAEAERLGFVNRVVPRARLVEETMALAQRIAMQDPFALRLCKASLNQMQDEMGFRTAVTGAYASYALSMERRVEQGQEFYSGSERAKRRDDAFGDHT